MSEKDFLSEVQQVFNQNNQGQDQGFDVIAKDFVKGFWELIFSKFAEHFKDERIKLSTEESEFLSNATVRWLKLRLPSFIAKYPVDFEFGFAVLSVALSKYLIIRQNAERNNNNSRAKGSGQDDISETDNKVVE